MNDDFKIKLAIFKVVKHITNKKIAESLEVSPHTVTNWGKTGKISRENAEKLVRFAPKHFNMKELGF